MKGEEGIYVELLKKKYSLSTACTKIKQSEGIIIFNGMQNADTATHEVSICYLNYSYANDFLQ